MGKPRINVILLDNLSALSGQYVNVLTFLTADQIADVVGNIGSMDVTVGFNQALATGLRVWAPAGTYLLTDKLLFAFKGQILQGSGRTATILKLTNAFNLAALGICVATCGEEGPQLRDIGMNFTQPDTAVRANLVAYPPAIYFRDTPRFTLNNVRIAGAMTGIDMKGNSGGAFIDTVEISAFNIHIDIDGCLDTVRLNNVHCWNFGTTTSIMTANQLTIYRDGSCIGLKVGTCDDLIMNSCLFISKGPQMYMHAGTGGTGCFGTAVNCDFDTYASIKCERGQMRFSSCFFSTADVNGQIIVQTLGWLSFNTCEFESAVVLANPMFQMSGSSTIATSPMLSMQNCQIRMAPDEIVFQAEQSSGNCNLILVGNMFMNTVDIAFTNPVIWAKAGARMTAIGNRITDKGMLAGTFIKLDTDEQHVVTGNSFTGWSFEMPAAQNFGVYQPNAGLPDPFISGNLVGPDRVLRYTGTLDGTGSATVAHGVSVAQKTVLTGNAWFKGASGEAKPLTISSIDGTDIFLTGGSTTLAAYRVALCLSASQSTW